MDDWVLRMRWAGLKAAVPESLLTREWLVANGLGGYASGTVAGVVTRRYHGLLIAALPAPLGRVVMLSHVAEQVRLAGGRRIEIGGRGRVAPGSGGRAPRAAAGVRREGAWRGWGCGL